MIQKLRPRDMIHPSLVAKKLHEVIDYLNEKEESANGDTHNNKDLKRDTGEDNQTRDKEESQEDNPGGSE